MTVGAESIDDWGRTAEPGLRLRRLRGAAVPLLFLSPFLLVFVIFMVVPLFWALRLSLFSERLVGGNVYVGDENFTRVLHDHAFWEGLGHSGLLGVVQIPIMLVLALSFALLLDSPRLRFRKVHRLAYFLPYAVPSVVGALMWGFLYEPRFGAIHQASNFFGLGTPQLLTSGGMLPAIGNILTWEYTGYNMVILYAALKAVPPELSEAGSVDGASGWAIARFIKVPLIAPALVLTGVFSIIGMLQLFNEPKIMSAIAPEVIGGNYTPNLYAYTVAFSNQDLNYAAAISFVLGAVVFASSYAFMLSTNRRGRGR
jgi:multiple sugar transport system permease protein